MNVTIPEDVSIFVVVEMAGVYLSVALTLYNIIIVQSLFNYFHKDHFFSNSD